MALDRNGLEILSREECLELLASRPVGRIGVSAYALPVILPVTYCLLGESVVFATGVGSKSLAVSHGNVIAFEVDEIDTASRAGWSVLVVGIAHEMDERDPDWDTARDLDLRPWVGRHAVTFVRLGTERLSGRRLHGCAVTSDRRQRVAFWR